MVEAIAHAMRRSAYPETMEGVEIALARLHVALSARFPDAGASGEGGTDADIRGDLNVLQAEARQLLLGLGPQATRVYVERRLRPSPTSVSDLAARLGIGEASVERLEELVCMRLQHEFNRPATFGPAAPKHETVAPDGSYVVCLECGIRKKMLRSHLRMAHGMSAEAYLERWDLEADHPLVAPAYSASKSDEAKSGGLGKKGRAGIYALPQRILETPEVASVLREFEPQVQEILRCRRMRKERESYRTLGERLGLTPTGVRRQERVAMEQLVSRLEAMGLEVPLGEAVRTSIGTTVKARLVR